MPDPLEADPFEDAVFLVRQALRRLENDEPQNAIWRLADALGILGDALIQLRPEGDYMGVDEPTGRRYIIARSTPLELRVLRSRTLGFRPRGSELFEEEE